MLEMPFLATEYFRAVRTRQDRAIIRDTMKITYFQDTDTLYIEFRSSEVVETRELGENTLLDVDVHGHLCALTLEHARERADIPHVTFEQVAA